MTRSRKKFVLKIHSKNPLKSKKIGKIAIFLRSGLKKTWFFAILGVF